MLINANQKEDIIRLYRDTDITFSGLAKQYGVSIGYIQSILVGVYVQGKNRADRHTLEFKSEVVQSYKSGKYTVEQIANKYGIGTSTVYLWNREYDNGVLSGSTVKSSKFSQDMVDSIIHDYLVEGFGTIRLSGKYNTHPTTIQHILKKHNVYKGNRGIQHKRTIGIDDSLIIDRYQEGDYTIKEVADYFNISKTKVYNVLRDAGIEKNESAPKKTCKSNSISEQVIEYYKTGLFTHKDLAQRYGVSTRTISRILDKAGIEAIISAKYATSDKIAEIKNGVLNDSLNGEDRYHIAIKYGVTLDTINRIISSGTQEVSEGDGSTGTKRSRAQSTVVELFKGGYSFKQIAQKTELSVPTVKTILKDLGIDHKATKSSKYKEDVLNDFNEGLTVDQISDKYSLSTPTVRLILKNGGVQNIRAAKVNLNGTKKDRVKDEVIKAYLEGLSAPDIAKRCGVSAPTVRTILRENDTPVRKQQMTPFMASRISELWKNFCDVDTVAKYVDLPKDMVLEELKRQGKTV